MGERPLVARMLFKELAPGDIRKLEKKSANVKTGRGARDLRFGNVEKLGPFIGEMLAAAGARPVIYKNSNNLETRFSRQRGGTLDQQPAFFAAPKSDGARREWRLCRINELALVPFESAVHALSQDQKALFLLLQRSDGSLWPHVIKDTSLANPKWEVETKSLLSRALAKRSNSGLAIGYKNYLSGDCYYND